MLSAQDSGSTEVVNAQMLGMGQINTLDTYLSPEKYSGPELRYISHTTRLKPGRQFSTQLTHYGSIVGSKKDAEVFKNNVDPAIQVVVKMA